MSFRPLVVCLALLPIALPGAVTAQEVSFSPDATSQCLADGGSGDDCIGLSADQCMDDSPGGYSTVGMNGCLEEERAWWDGQLNKAYGTILSLEQQTDADPAYPDQPSGEAALRDMQRAWIAYRDSTCNYEVLQWYGGTGANGAWLGCLMRLTGEQTLYLRSLASEG